MAVNRDLLPEPAICEYLYKAFVHKQKGLSAQNIHHLDDGPMTFVSSQRATRSAKVLPIARSFRAVTCLFLLGLALGGCTKCGWLWDEAPQSCRADAPR